MAAVDLRYARALDAVVGQQGASRDEVQQQLADFVATLGGSPELREVLGDPSISQEQKVRALDAIAARAGLNGTVRNFLAVVTAHERIGELHSIVTAFGELADLDSGITEAEVISARPLDAAGRRSLEGGIARMTGDTRVRAVYREDPALLGGAVVKVGSTVYDGSVRGQLEQMKQRLTAATF